MHEPDVTVVIAAYGRADALVKTLQSVHRQTHTRWRVLIVADHCADDFFDGIEIDGDKVRAINLPVRCGNQYGPNSIGIALAQTRYVALLNHDDLWLPDHLEIALDALSRDGNDFFFGTAAFCHARNQAQSLSTHGRLRFSELNRPQAIWRCLSGPNAFFEPASSWVFDTDLAKRVGHWRAPSVTTHMSVMDWVARVARQGARFCFADRLTALKFNLHHEANGAPQYQQQSIGVEALDRFIGPGADEIRAWVDDDLPQAQAAGLYVREFFSRPVEMTEDERLKLSMFLLYVSTSVDYAHAVQRHDAAVSLKGALDMLENRTGERPSGFPTVDAVLEAMAAHGQR